MPKSPRTLTPDGLDVVAGKFKALADPSRLAILQVLLAGECSVGDLVEATGLSQPNTSRHLGVLRKAGLVDCRKEWPHCVYYVADPGLETICEVMCESAARERGPLFR